MSTINHSAWNSILLLHTDTIHLDSIFPNPWDYEDKRIRIHMYWKSLDCSWLEILLLLLCNEVLCTALLGYTKSHAIIWCCIDHIPSSHWCIYSSSNCSPATWQELHLLQGGGILKRWDMILFMNVCVFMTLRILIQCIAQKRFLFGSSDRLKKYNIYHLIHVSY